MAMSRSSVALALGAGAVGVTGHSHYMVSIPNGMKVKRGGVVWYGVGHEDNMGSGPRNVFGEAFAAAGYRWTPELCAADSDGDGQSNGLELGDPDCVWTAGRGELPSRSSDISHPGFADSTTDAGSTTAAAASSTTAESASTVAPTTSSLASLTTAATTAASTTAAPTSTASSTTASSTSVAASSTASAPTSDSTTSAAADEGLDSSSNTTEAPTTTTASVDAGDDAHLDALCDFDNEPMAVGYMWDSSCRMGMLGCNADGRHVQCRFCGAGAYESIPCPPRSCRFANEPFVPYYWDPTCEMGKLGCWADGVHAHCRFCGLHPYTSLPCPAVVGGRAGSPAAPAAESSRDSRCRFANEPAMPYYWDAECAMGKLGCMADGVHEQCRFCAHRPFEGIACPAHVAPPTHRCTFPGEQPAERFYWDASCQMGMLGCWADGVHAECRFCGGSTYWNVTCPTVLVTGAPAAAEPDSGAAASLSQGVGAAAHDMPAAEAGDEELVDLSAASRMGAAVSMVLAALSFLV